MNKLGKGSRRFFAVVSLSKERWYWVVWPSLEELQTSEEPISRVGEGIERTKAEAVENALELAGINAAWIEAKYAKAFYRGKVTTKLKRKGIHLAGDASSLHLQEFLYQDVYDVENNQWVSMPHRVVKRTGNYIYVEQIPYAPENLTRDWLDRDIPTYRLDRQSLEKDGYAFIPATAFVADTEEPIFYLDERSMRQRSPYFDCLKELELSWPCTLEEVKEAYRKAVKFAHPDGGGSHEQFLKLQEAYEQALQLCQQFTDKSLGNEKTG